MGPSPSSLDLLGHPYLNYSFFCEMGKIQFSLPSSLTLGYAGPFPLLAKEELEEGIILIVNLGFRVKFFKCSS